MGSAPVSIILELAIISVTHLFLLKSGYKDLFCLLVFFFFFFLPLGQHGLVSN